MYWSKREPPLVLVSVILAGFVSTREKLAIVFGFGDSRSKVLLGWEIPQERRTNNVLGRCGEF